MVEPAGDPCLAEEALELRRPIPPNFQRLDRHGAFELEIERLVDHAHPATADLADEPVAPAGPRHADRHRHASIDIGARFAGMHHRPPFGAGQRPEVDGLIDRPDGELGVEGVVEGLSDGAIVAADDSLRLRA